MNTTERCNHILAGLDELLHAVRGVHRVADLTKTVAPHYVTLQLEVRELALETAVMINTGRALLAAWPVCGGPFRQARDAVHNLHVLRDLDRTACSRMALYGITEDDDELPMACTICADEMRRQGLRADPLHASDEIAALVAVLNEDRPPTPNEEP